MAAASAEIMASGPASAPSPPPTGELEERAFLLEDPNYEKPSTEKKKPKLAKRLLKATKRAACLLACNFCWACCCCKQLQLEVHGGLAIGTDACRLEDDGIDGERLHLAVHDAAREHLVALPQLRCKHAVELASGQYLHPCFVRLSKYIRERC